MPSDVSDVLISKEKSGTKWRILVRSTWFAVGTVTKL